jgi:hypothetical protein
LQKFEKKQCIFPNLFLAFLNFSEFFIHFFALFKLFVVGRGKIINNKRTNLSPALADVVVGAELVPKAFQLTDGERRPRALLVRRRRSRLRCPRRCCCRCWRWRFVVVQV